ncbi:hypothetical protein SUGI_0389940 [Cryptomeria japonica]|uniref:uncharacterized protein LOC131063579 n=1 Tax=Cryptomeria japonica TaxID=3369 RepID=UPI002408E49C|nr:uncharacterized protein LOC131063579 [Cryptomeria japonica]GLJ21248.1 hypothetical protein SUGI_0389940 [Cryptomeria japonica]
MERKGLLFLPVLFLSVILMALLNLEKRKHAGEVLEYESHGWFRESAAWDAKGRRFLVSFMEGGLGQIGETSKEEYTVVKDGDYAGKATLGLEIDLPRGRTLVAVADLFGKNYSALAAYDMATWQRIFLVQLSSAGAKSLADDVAVDAEGNSYVTDAYGNVIWKVSPEGSVVAVISSPAFNSVPATLPFNMVGLNGIVYHPGGYLLAVHTWAGVLFKISLDGQHVTAVNMSSFLVMGDGLELLTPERLVVAGMPSARIVESRDDWRSAKLTHRYVGPMHRGATAVTVKDGKAFVSHILGLGLRKRTHLITEAVFKPVSL